MHSRSGGLWLHLNKKLRNASESIGIQRWRFDPASMTIIAEPTQQRFYRTVGRLLLHLASLVIMFYCGSRNIGSFNQRTVEMVWHGPVRGFSYLEWTRLTLYQVHRSIRHEFSSKVLKYILRSTVFLGG